MHHHLNVHHHIIFIIILLYIYTKHLAQFKQGNLAYIVSI